MGSAMIVVPEPYSSPRLFDGWAALLAFPKLYGALLLWALCIFLVTRGERFSSSPEL
jgi:hypothetical protein